jgi:hypothetical protein
MAALPPVKGIRLEDVLREDGNLDGERLVGLLNQFMLGVVRALSDLTIEENFRAMRKTLNITTRPSVENTFPLYFEMEKGMQSVRGCWVERVLDKTTTSGQLVTGVTAHVVPTGDGRAEVRYVSGLAPETKYEVNLVVFG